MIPEQFRSFDATNKRVYIAAGANDIDGRITTAQAIARNIGSHYLDLGDYAAAERYLLVAREMYLRDKSPYMHNVFRFQIDLAKARNLPLDHIDAIYADAIDKMPGWVEWLFQRGRWSVENDYRLADGIEYLKTFISRRDESPVKRPLEDVCYLVALGYHKLGDAKSAKEWLEMALSSNPSHNESKALRATTIH